MKTVAFLFLIGIAFSATASAAPAISVDEASYDFGSVVQGTIVSHAFVLTNVGDETLTINRVTATCGCTTTALSDTSLAPGESVELQARVDTTAFIGAIAKTVNVYSNDPNYASDTLSSTTETRSPLSLHITGTVIEGNIQPYNITAGDLSWLLFLMVDLRDPDTYAAGHLVGAINIPYDELPQWIDQLPTDLLIVFYDQDGTDADAAAELLLAAGFGNVQSLYGGLDNWLVQFGDVLLMTSE
jgi:rhodanese-related sulfurtransferase